MPPRRPASWLARSLTTEIAARLETTQQLHDLVREAIHAMRARFDEAHIDSLTPTEQPTSGLAVARIIEVRLEWALAGDCQVAWRDADGWHLEQGPALPRLDRAAVEDLAAYQQQGMDPALAREAIAPLLIEHRALANRPGGYAVVDLHTPVADISLTFGSHPLAGITHVAAFSDGFAQLWDTMALTASGEVLDDLPRAAQWVRRLVTAQADDPTLETHPRFKQYDDVAVAWGAVVSQAASTGRSATKVRPHE